MAALLLTAANCCENKCLIIGGAKSDSINDVWYLTTLVCVFALQKVGTTKMDR